MTAHTLADSIGLTRVIETFDGLGTSDPLDEIDVVKARLAARGLLRTEQTVLAPRPATRQPVARAAVFAPALPDVVSVPTGEVETWDVEPTSGTMAAVACPRCRQQHPWPADVTRFACASCDRGWRWASCTGCHHLTLVVEVAESWRCGECGNSTRSWWRTPEMRREAAGVVARRRDAAAQAERARLLVAARRRRRRIAVGAAAGATLVAAFVGTVRSAEPTAAEATAATCSRFERLRSQLANGTATPAGVTAELGELRAASAAAEADVQAAVIELSGAGRPGQATFLVASTKLADACQ